MSDVMTPAPIRTIVADLGDVDGGDLRLGVLHHVGERLVDDEVHGLGDVG